jgi:hypothetical protein
MDFQNLLVQELKSMMAEYPDKKKEIDDLQTELFSNMLNEYNDNKKKCST